MGRLKIWSEVLRPTSRWLFIIPLALLGTIQSIRDEFLPTAIAEAFRLPIFLPNWSWTQWALLVLILVVLLTLEGAYQAVRKRELAADVLTARLDRRSVLETLLNELAGHQVAGSDLYARRITSDADLAEWVDDVMRWRSEVADTISIGVNPAAAQALDLVDSVNSASTAGAYNNDHNAKRLYHRERINRLRKLTDDIQSELRSA